MAPDDTPVVPGDGTEHNNLIAEAVGKSDSNSEFAAKRMPGFLDALWEVDAGGISAHATLSSSGDHARANPQETGKRTPIPEVATSGISNRRRCDRRYFYSF